MSKEFRLSGFGARRSAVDRRGPERVGGGARMVRPNRYQDYFYLHGLSVEMAEALAEYVHKRIRGELGFVAEEARDPDAMLAQGYRGSRYSFGYPACPNLADQKQLLALLRGEEIGITLSEEDQLDPEQSTSAIVLHHPQAKYFSV
jgi:5-methyltetrahydrofolate--homocysteine methyltransferase